MTTLTFQKTTLSVINQQNQIWFSISDIASALGYKETNGVTRLYNAHQDEFTPCMTALMDMQTNGGIQKVRIFSLRGCHLIGMLSHTKVAKDFRKWVLDILDREVSQKTEQISPLAPALPKHSSNAALGLRSLLPLVIYYRDVSQMAKEFNEICHQLGRGRHSGLSAVLHNYASAFDDNAALVRKVRGVLLTQFGQLPQDDQDYLRDFIEL